MARTSARGVRDLRASCASARSRRRALARRRPRPRGIAIASVAAALEARGHSVDEWAQASGSTSPFAIRASRAATSSASRPTASPTRGLRQRRDRLRGSSSAGWGGASSSSGASTGGATRRPSSTGWRARSAPQEPLGVTGRFDRVSPAGAISNVARIRRGETPVPRSDGFRLGPPGQVLARTHRRGCMLSPIRGPVAAGPRPEERASFLGDMAPGRRGADGHGRGAREPPHPLQPGPRAPPT